jgi:hypothetical protein
MAHPWLKSLAQRGVQPEPRGRFHLPMLGNHLPEKSSPRLGFGNGLRLPYRRNTLPGKLYCFSWLFSTRDAGIARAGALACRGIVAKHKSGPYVTKCEQSTWFKIRNPNYSHIIGREKLFEREQESEPVPG